MSENVNNDVSMNPPIHTVSAEFNLELICTSNEPLRRVQFHLFEKLTSANQFQIEREKPYDYFSI